jgi:phage recombination protein Bet
MTKEISKTENSVLTEYKDKIEYIKNLCIVNPYTDYVVSNNDLEFYLQFCKSHGQDPLKRDVYCIMRASYVNKVKVVKPSIQSSIDWFRKVAEMSGKYAGQTKPEFEMEGDKLISCSIGVKKLVGNIIVETWATAYFEEYAQYTGGYTDKYGNETAKKLNSQWEKMPRGQLAKCCEALALRKAFPEILAGIYSEEEGNIIEQNNNPIKSEADQPNEELINEIVELAENKGFKKATIEKKYGNIELMTVNKINQIKDSLKNLPDAVKPKDIKPKDDKKANVIDITPKKELNEVEAKEGEEYSMEEILDVLDEGDDLTKEAKSKIEEIKKNNKK